MICLQGCVSQASVMWATKASLCTLTRTESRNGRSCFGVSLFWVLQFPLHPPCGQHHGAPHHHSQPDVRWSARLDVHALVLSCAQLVRSIPPHFTNGASSTSIVSQVGSMRVRWVSTVSGPSRAQKVERERGLHQPRSQRPSCSCSAQLRLPLFHRALSAGGSCAAVSAAFKLVQQQKRHRGAATKGGPEKFLRCRASPRCTVCGARRAARRGHRAAGRARR